MEKSIKMEAGERAMTDESGSMEQAPKMAQDRTRSEDAASEAIHLNGRTGAKTLSLLR